MRAERESYAAAVPQPQPPRPNYQNALRPRTGRGAGSVSADPRPFRGVSRGSRRRGDGLGGGDAGRGGGSGRAAISVLRLAATAERLHRAGSDTGHHVPVEAVARAAEHPANVTGDEEVGLVNLGVAIEAEERRVGGAIEGRSASAELARGGIHLL